MNTGPASPPIYLFKCSLVFVLLFLSLSQSQSAPVAPKFNFVGLGSDLGTNRHYVVLQSYSNTSVSWNLGVPCQAALTANFTVNGRPAFLPLNDGSMYIFLPFGVYNNSLSVWILPRENPTHCALLTYDGLSFDGLPADGAVDLYYDASRSRIVAAFLQNGDGPLYIYQLNHDTALLETLRHGFTSASSSRDNRDSDKKLSATATLLGQYTPPGSTSSAYVSLGGGVLSATDSQLVLGLMDISDPFFGPVTYVLSFDLKQNTFADPFILYNVPSYHLFYNPGYGYSLLSGGIIMPGEIDRPNRVIKPLARKPASISHHQQQSGAKRQELQPPNFGFIALGFEHPTNQTTRIQKVFELCPQADECGFDGRWHFGNVYRFSVRMLSFMLSISCSFLGPYENFFTFYGGVSGYWIYDFTSGMLSQAQYRGSDILFVQDGLFVF